MNRDRLRALSAGAAGLVLLLTLVVYWPGLNGPLILDDLVNLDILRVLAEQHRLTLAQVLAERGGVWGGRPVAWLSFVWNWRMTGADVWSFKLANLVVHCCNGILVLLVSRVLLREGTVTPAPPRQAGLVAILIATLWLLAPMQVSTVLYVVQRMTLLAATFTLAGMLAYCHGRVMLRQQPIWGGLLIAFSVLICWPLAALSKQNGVMLIFLLLSLEFFVLDLSRCTSRWPMALLSALCVLTLGAGVAKFVADPDWVLGMYAIRDFTLSDRLLTQPRVLTDYALSLLQLPGGTPLALFHDDFPLSTGVVTPPSTLMHLLLWTALPVIAWRARRGPLRLAGFGLVCYLLTHALEAGPFPLEIYFEHRNYLPSFGLLLALGCLVQSAMHLAPRARKTIASVCAIVIVGYAGLTAARVGVWTSWEGIVEANARSHPGSARARAGVAIIEFSAGRLDTGLHHLGAVLATGGPRMHAGIAFKALVGYCLADLSPVPAAYSDLAAVLWLDDDPYTINALRWYRAVAAGRPCPGLDRDRVAGLVSSRIGMRDETTPYAARWLLHDEAAHLLVAVGREAQASQHLSRALAGAPTSLRRELSNRLRALRASPN